MTHHKNWNTPSKTKLLTIPKLQFTKTQNTTEIEKTLKHLSLPITSQFIKAWEEERKESDLEKLKKDLIIIADTLCKLIKKGQKGIKFTHKSSPDDVVTEMDQGIEMLLRLWIQTHYPSHKIIGEEGYKDTLNTEDFIWYIDPIDGTNNFIKGEKDVSLHIACLSKGEIIISYVGLPFKKNQFHTHTKENAPFRLPEILTIGTEYLPHRGVDENHLNTLITHLSCKTHRVKSIGVHILNLMEGKVSAFFKSGAKLWDFIAPLAILDHYQKDLWEIELFIKSEKDPSQWISLSPFSNQEKYILCQNEKHQIDCRIGTILVTPKSLPQLRETLLKIIL